MFKEIKKFKKENFRTKITNYIIKEKGVTKKLVIENF